MLQNLARYVRMKLCSRCQVSVSTPTPLHQKLQHRLDEGQSGNLEAVANRKDDQAWLVGTEVKQSNHYGRALAVAEIVEDRHIDLGMYAPVS